MKTPRERITQEAEKPAPVSPEAAAEYRQRADRLVAEVDRKLAARPEIGSLIGDNPLSVMWANHRHHAGFMANVFQFNNFDLLTQTVPWVYRAYHSHGFSYDYFRAELTVWIEAVKEHLSSDSARSILPVYGWLLEKHEEMTERSRTPTSPLTSPDPVWEEVQKAFLSSLLLGASEESMNLANRYVRNQEELRGFYLHVIQSSMYEIGASWERGEISVAQEHLATSISGRVMAALYPRFVLGKQTKGRAVVTTVADEFHELGAWMVADLLALDGWNVSYLGANTPTGDLLDMLTRLGPDLVALSSAMPFNLIRVQEVIEAIRARNALEPIRIMVGGRVFRDAEDLWCLVGADGWAPDAQEASLLARNWWEEVGRR
jgi:methanogenic corrinoid protein MtbC1